MAHENLSKVFNAHLNILDALIDDLKENMTTWSGEEISLEFFWIKICLAVQNTSKEATNLCMSFSGPPLPEIQECEPILRRLEGMAVAVVAAFYSLPLTCGLTLKKHIHTAVTDIVKSIHMLVTTILAHNFNCSKEQLQKTGNVWECCDNFPLLPRDNVGVVSSNLREWQGLVNDALDEIQSALIQCDEEDVDDITDMSDDMDTPQWSDMEKTVVHTATGIVKTSKAMLKKCSTVVKNQSSSEGGPQVSALDDLNERLHSISAGVDEVIACLYPPLDHIVVRQNVADLATFLEGVLDHLRHSTLTCDVDETWLTFLGQAVNHNRDKLDQLVPAQ